jgi:NhaA family Na+:H+ antiporter
MLIKARIASFPKEVSLMNLYGVSCIAGVGFTMALFVGKLSLPEAMQEEVRLGILCGSLLSALWGGIVFQWQEYINKKKPVRYL